MICCFLLQLSLTKSKDGDCLEERSDAAVSLMLPTKVGPRSASGTSRWWSIISRDVAAAAHLRYLETHRKISAESFSPRMEEVLRQSGCHGAVFSPVLVSYTEDFIYFVVSEVIHLIYKLVVLWLNTWVFILRAVVNAPLIVLFTEEIGNKVMFCEACSAFYTLTRYSDVFYIMMATLILCFTHARFADSEILYNYLSMWCMTNQRVIYKTSLKCLKSTLYENGQNETNIM